MSGGFQFLDIVFFAMIAIFILLRLRSVLGRRTGQERRDAESFERRAKPPEKPRPKVVGLPDRSRADAEVAGPAEAEPNDASRPRAGAGGTGSAVELGLTQIAIADPGFDRREFLKGAGAAFEMILEAFAKADTAALRPLLADDVYDQFVAAIRERLARKQRLETTLVGIDSCDILEAELAGRTANVTVKFVSEQIKVTRDAENEVVAGSEDKVSRVTDIWTFTRNTRSRDPNWLLSGTRSLT